jgi:beta-glucanase (GH16 family)
VLTRLTISNPAKIAVSKAPGGWTEGVTYSTAPKPGTPFVTVADDGKSAQLRIDVSKGITEAGELNLAVTQPVGAGGTIFGSREAGAKQTKLEIAYVRKGTTGPVPSMPTSAPTSAPTTVKPTQSPTATPTTPTPTTTTPTTASPTPTPTASPTTTSPTSTPPTTGLAPSWSATGSYRLTFQDEFNAAAVDTTKWERGWFKEGISDGVNSDNLQCYDTRQVTESGGFLNLTLAQREAYCRGGTKQYVSGLVNTRKSFNQRFGSFEARVCLPDGNGDGRVDGFPAWWTNGPSSVPWPDHGEIDILEGIGGGTKASLHYVNPVYHGGTYSPTPLAGCHNFGSQWTSSGVTFYYDGKPMWSHAFTGPLPQFLIFNYAVRPHSGEAITPGTAVRVDWVRVWA